MKIEYVCIFGYYDDDDSLFYYVGELSEVLW